MAKRKRAARQKAKATKPLRVVAIADLHTGSRVGLADSRVANIRDPGYRVRAAMYERYEAATQGEWHAPDVLLVVGDALDGNNRKAGGVGTWTTDLLEQADHAADLIQMWDARNVHVLRGSGYHVMPGGSGLNMEEYIARKIGAVEYPNQEDVDPQRRERSGWHWYLTFQGVTFHVSHKISVSRVFHYQSTPTARALLNARLNNHLRHKWTTIPDVARDKVGGAMKDEVQFWDRTLKVRVVLRAHAHYFNHVGYSGSDGFVLPCWKAQDDYMLANGPLDISPDLGFLGFEINDTDITVAKELFRLEDVQQPPHTIY